MSDLQVTLADGRAVEANRVAGGRRWRVTVTTTATQDVERPGTVDAQARALSEALTELGLSPEIVLDAELSRLQRLLGVSKGGS